MQTKDYLEKYRTKDYYRGSMKQIGFIVGTGRCGSTLLAQVLNAHPKICVPHELQIIVSIGNGDRLSDKYRSGEYKNYKADDFINLIARCCPYHFSQFFDYHSHFNNLSYPQNNLSELLAGLFDHICYKYGKEIFIEQTPWYGQKLGELLEIFPHMKLIHLVRDGRDVAISYARTPWWSKDIRANLEQWADEVEHIESYRDKLGGRFTQIRYEDLICNLEEKIGQVLDLFGLKFQPEMILPENLIDYSKMFIDKNLDFESDAQKQWNMNNRNKVNLNNSIRNKNNRGKNQNDIFFRDSLQAWKRHDGFDFSHIPSKTAEILQKHGYEI